MSRLGIFFFLGLDFIGKVIQDYCVPSKTKSRRVALINLRSPNNNHSHDNNLVAGILDQIKDTNIKLHASNEDILKNPK